MDEDKVDRFLHYYIALEILVSILKKEDNKEYTIKKFCNRFGVTYYYDDQHDLKWIRNKLVHSAGEDKEKAEELAKKYADTLGNEIFQVIKMIIESRTLNI